MSKPSEEARQLAYDNPSQDSECRRFMEYLAARHEPVRCDCDHADMERYALAIDALVQRAVERERERCAKIADTFEQVAKADARFDAQEDARFIAEQIRGEP